MSKLPFDLLLAAVHENAGNASKLLHRKPYMWAHDHVRMFRVGRGLGGGGDRLAGSTLFDVRAKHALFSSDPLG